MREPPLTAELHGQAHFTSNYFHRGTLHNTQRIQTERHTLVITQTWACLSVICIQFGSWEIKSWAAHVEKETRQVTCLPSSCGSLVLLTCVSARQSVNLSIGQVMPEWRFSTNETVRDKVNDAKEVPDLALKGTQPNGFCGFEVNRMWGLRDPL